MKFNLATGLRNATRLTRSGRLAEAVQVIQQALGNNRAASPAPRPAKFVTPRIGTADRAGSTDAEPPQNAKAWPFSVLTPGNHRRRGRTGGNFGIRHATDVSHPSPIPDGAEFPTRHFSTPAGARAYKLYIPSALKAPRGLLIMLHGCTQDADDFARGTGMNAIAEERGMVVAYPVQPCTANASRCWNWFEPKDQSRGRGEPEIIAGLTRALIAEFAIDPNRVFVAGLSAGGAMADILGATYPELYSAIGIHSGLPHGSATSVVSALSAMKGPNARPAARGGTRKRTPRVIVFHGSADRTVVPENGEKIVEQALADTEWSQERTIEGRSEGGVVYTRLVATDANGVPIVERWILQGVGHAWSGGSTEGSYTDPCGPDASREMVRFFCNDLT